MDARSWRLWLRDARRHRSARPLAGFDDATQIHDHAIVAHRDKILVEPAVRAVRGGPARVEREEASGARLTPRRVTEFESARRSRRDDLHGTFGGARTRSPARTEPKSFRC